MTIIRFVGDDVVLAGFCDTNHQAQVTVTAGHSKMNAVMIALGASIATAIGFVGTSLGLNVWRNHQNND